MIKRYEFIQQKYKLFTYNIIIQKFFPCIAVISALKSVAEPLDGQKECGN